MASLRIGSDSNISVVRCDTSIPESGYLRTGEYTRGVICTAHHGVYDKIPDSVDVCAANHP